MRILLDTHVFLWYVTADGDPFDRILVAQALDRGLTLATLDDAVRAYPVPLLPAP